MTKHEALNYLNIPITEENRIDAKQIKAYLVNEEKRLNNGVNALDRDKLIKEIEALKALI